MTEPYCSHAGIVIYHGDAADILPGLPDVDLLAMDPPYGIGEAAGKNKTRSKAFGSRSANCGARVIEAPDYGNDTWDNEPWSADLLALAFSKGEYQAIWGGNYYDLPPTPSWLIWDKENSGDFADGEMCWTNYGTALRIKRHMWNGMLRKGREPRMHPTQKPLDVVAWSIRLCPGEVRTVLDPCMGSGTTLRACKDMGIKAVGIERIERYCEIAAKRLAQEVLF